MLAELYVENFALIEKLSLPLDGGLCALSGETGRLYHGNGRRER